MMSELGLRDKWELLKLYRRREKVFAKLGSRKLWAAVVGATLVTLGAQLGLPAETVENIVQIVIGYIVGQGMVDAAAAYKIGGAK